MSKHPPLAPLKSSAITGHHYDPASGVLHLGFASGGVYRYRGFPKDKADALAKAESAGGYFHAHIRDKHDGELVK
jgi:hypothetical protein